eukprot:s2399_g3.t4
MCMAADGFGLRLLEAGEVCEEVGEDLEVFSSAGRGRGLRGATAAPGDVVLAEQAVLAEPCASGEEFAIAAQEDWKQLGAFSRAKLLSLRWRSAVKEGSELPTATALGPLRDWPRPEPSEHLSQVATATASKAPGIPRLRGVAAFNGMAVLKMVVKPSVLKTIEAQPRHGLAIYPDGSLLNHSCLPNVNRLPFPSCLVVRAARDLLPQDELTCTYIEVRAPPFARRAELEDAWGFECGCGRCQLEAKIWAAEPEAEKRARSLWRRFERRRREGACSEQDLREMVAEAADCTGEVLRRFLQTGTEGDFQGEAAVYRPALGCEDPEHPELDTQSESTRAASALLNLLLGSYWVAPAWELAFGLQEAARHAEALELWLAVRRVNAELLPLSPSHAAAAAEAALAAVASGSKFWRELLEEGPRSRNETVADGFQPESLRVAAGAYGPGAWGRLAAARLEQLSTEWRRAIEQVAARAEKGLEMEEIAGLDLEDRSHHIIFRSLRTSRTWIEKMRKLCKSIRKTSWCGGVEKTAVYLPAECSISLKKDRWIVALGAKAGEPDPQACHERAFNAPPGKLLVTAGELDWYEPLRQGPESDYAADSCGSDAEKYWYSPVAAEEEALPPPPPPPTAERSHRAPVNGSARSSARPSGAEWKVSSVPIQAAVSKANGPPPNDLARAGAKRSLVHGTLEARDHQECSRQMFCTACCCGAGEQVNGKDRGELDPDKPPEEPPGPLDGHAAPPNKRADDALNLADDAITHAAVLGKACC